MPWSLLLAAFLQFIAPLLLKWLEELLKRTVESLEKEESLSPNLFPSTALQELIVWSKAHELLQKEGAAISWWNIWGKSVHTRRIKIFNRLMEQGIQRLGLISEDVTSCILSKEDIAKILED